MATSRSPGATCANTTRGLSLARIASTHTRQRKAMCGRAKLDSDISEIKIAFRVPPDYPTHQGTPIPTPRLVGSRLSSCTRVETPPGCAMS